MRRKSSGLDGVPPSNRLRLTILLATVAAFLAVPAAQAFAETAHLKLNIVGTGSGEVESIEEESLEMGPGTPPIACSYNGASQSGQCENVPSTLFSEPEDFGERMFATPASDSELVGWTVDRGKVHEEAREFCPLSEEVKEVCQVYSLEEGEIEWEVTVEFAAKISGPPLTTVIEEGSGTVVSNPAGISCTGAAPHECTTEEIAEGEHVTLTASPASGYLFKGWKNCDAGGVNGRQCTITLTPGHKPVSAKFVKVYQLTLSNGGNGEVSSKPAGALCMPNCSSTSAYFEAGKTVEVLAKPNKHFHLASWGGACSGSGACSVTMGESHTVSATFAEDPKFSLGINKTGHGQAQIKTKGPGTVCGYTCSGSVASFYSGEVVTVSWKLNKGTSSLHWNSGEGTCTGTFSSPEGSCTVTMSHSSSLTPQFE